LTTSLLQEVVEVETTLPVLAVLVGSVLELH
jgi:hypothetical protein